MNVLLGPFMTEQSPLTHMTDMIPQAELNDLGINKSGKLLQS